MRWLQVATGTVVIALLFDSAVLVSLGACDEESCYDQVARASRILGAIWVVLAALLVIALVTVRRRRGSLLPQRLGRDIALILPVDLCVAATWLRSANSESDAGIAIAILSFVVLAALLLLSLTWLTAWAVAGLTRVVVRRQAT